MQAFHKKKCPEEHFLILRNAEGPLQIEHLVGSEVDLNEVAGLVEERHGELGIGRYRGMDELSGGRIDGYTVAFALCRCSLAKEPVSAAEMIGVFFLFHLLSAGGIDLVTADDVEHAIVHDLSCIGHW